MEEERLIKSEAAVEDIDEISLRPRKFSEYIGQTKVKENLSIFIEAAKKGERKRLTMCFFMDRPAWERPLWPV
jgi:Holliday junction resolvasome RuvABC ATP-dependent DNA helicase subunit